MTERPTKKQILLDAFRDAGLRGLTGREMLDLIGENWRRRLVELEADGYVFNGRKSRYQSGRIYRWVLVVEPAEGETCELPAELRLLDPPAPAPASALTEAAA